MELVSEPISSVLPLSSLIIVIVSVALLLWKFLLSRTGSSAVAGGKSAPKNQVPEANGTPDEKKKVVFLYATQTGTAEGFSKTLAEEVRCRYEGSVAVDVHDVDEYAKEDSDYFTRLRSENLVFFLQATYGDGEPTDSASRFYKWLMDLAKSQEEADDDKPFDGVSFGVFGLGNRQYEHFNAVGKAIDKALDTLGATRVVPLGLGDDDQCIEDDFAEWKKLVFLALDTALNSSGVAGGGAVALPQYRVELLEGGAEAGGAAGAAVRRWSQAGAPADAAHPCAAAVVERRELHAALSERSCLHVEVDLRGTQLTYQTGDHLGIYPENQPDVVAAVAQCLGLPLSTRFSLHTTDEEGRPLPGSANLPAPFPTPTTLGSALAHHACLLTSPKKNVLLALAAYASNEAEKERLTFLASPEGKEEYAEWVVRASRSLVEVLQAFPSVKPPLGVFFAAIAPRLQPRFYSISSSASAWPEVVHITCAVVRGPTPTGRLHEGVTSTWLERCSLQKTPVPIFIRTSTFRLPSDPKLPVVMIGPGTGLAPFRGFLQERRAMRARGVQLGSAVLFFGCRSRKQDFIYEEELQSFLADGSLTALHVAFSREGAEKQYVQHKLLQEAATVWPMVAETHLGGQGGHLYVCGDAKSMARDVHRTIINIIQTQEATTQSKAEGILQKMTERQKYQRDVW